MQQLKKGYPLRVWFTTLVLGTLLFLGIVLGMGEKWKPVGFFFLVLLISFVLSLPAFLLNTFICRAIAGSRMEERQAKALIAVTGVILIGITFGIVFSSPNNSKIDDGFEYLIYAYIFSSVIVAFCFPLREKAEVLTFPESDLPTNEIP